jgi:hypothetical protein
MTFQDACELVWHMFNPAVKPPTGRELNAARNAVIRAYRDLPQRHRWNYYARHGIITTTASQSTGTVVYDHTSGAYERMVTLTGATWPADAARGTVKIAGAYYDIEDYKSTAIITLSADTNPGSDISTGSSYTWVRDSYPLPVNFRRFLSLGETGTSATWNPLEYLSPGQFHDTVKSEGGGPADRPNYYTIRSSGDYVGALEIVFGKAPNAARTYDMLYEVSPRELTTYKYSTGTVSVAAGGVAVVGGSTVFNSQHVGAVIRFTESTSEEPTSPAGHVDGVCNPFLSQRVITAVADTTHLTIGSILSATTSLSSVKYVISDPIDIEPIVMRTAFETLCLANYAFVQKREDFKDLQSQAMQELILAMGQDSRSTQPRSGTEQPWFHSAIGEVDVV